MVGWRGRQNGQENALPAQEVWQIMKCPMEPIRNAMFEPICEPFQAKDAPEPVPEHDAWSYLMTRRDGSPFAWHTLAVRFSKKIAMQDGMGETWYSLYRNTASCGVRGCWSSRYNCPCKKFVPDPTFRCLKIQGEVICESD